MFERSHLRSPKATSKICPSDLNSLSSSDQQASSQHQHQHQQKRRFFWQSSFRRAIIAVATWRLTSTSTLTTSAGSLAAILKSLLVGCYYFLAFTSLLMLILYINHVASLTVSTTSSSPSTTIITAITSTSTIIRHSHLLPAPNAILLSPNDLFENANSSGNQEASEDYNEKRNIRVKRSAATATTTLASKELTSQTNGEPIVHEAIKSATIDHQHVNQQKSPSRINRRLESQLRSTGRTKSALPARKIIPDHSIMVDLSDHSVESGVGIAPISGALMSADSSSIRERRVAQPPLPELTERQAGYSLNNRGTMTNNNNSSQRMQQTPVESQWIPIVGSGRQESRARKSQQRQNRPQTNIMANQKRPPKQPSIVPAASADTIHVDHYHPHDERRKQNQRNHYRHHYQHQLHNNRNQPPNHHHNHQNHRQWRRPRLNQLHEAASFRNRHVSKMYKRVLLCEKTLVSLDYIRNLELEPQPYEHFESDNFADNFIDLDSNLDQILADRRSDTVAPPTGNSNSSSSGGSNASSGDELSTQTTNVAATIEKRSYYLRDEDPLVKCDMWDLEKGLKNRKPPPEILQMAVKADFDTVRDAINRCRQLSERTLPAEDEFRDGLEIMSTDDLISLFSMKRGLIPGTKWCGLGDQASSYNDLGPKHRIDICCRAHDHCPIRLKPFRNDYGVLNIALYTKSHCDCDADFYRCLREVHSRTADMLGNLYFNVMKLQCMREERVKICREMKPIALGFERCVRYEDSPMKTVFKFTTPPVAY